MLLCGCEYVGQVPGGGSVVAVAQKMGSWEEELDMEQGRGCRAGKKQSEDRLEASSTEVVLKKEGMT